MTSERPIAQRDLLCANCGGQCAFEPETGCLTCGSCGTQHEIAVDPNADPAAEQHYHPTQAHTEQPEFTQDRRYLCETCGGEVVFRGHSISERCPYCDGALVERVGGESYETLGLIPFALGAEVALTNARKWVRDRWAAPSDLADVVAVCEVAGLYVPFWTFDSKEAVDYTLIYKKRRNKRTSFVTTSGHMKTEFDDLLMPASHHVTPLIRDGILHDFEPGDLLPVDPAYLAGFAAELHHQSVREGLRHNEKDKAVLLRQRIKQHAGRQSVVKISFKTDTTGIRYRRILLPVWILHYTYGGQAMKVVTCGIRGRTFGERPFSATKLFAMATLAAGLVGAFGFVWGALNLY